MLNLVVRDPADVRSVVGEVPAMTPGDVAAAQARARASFETWRRTSPPGLRFYTRIKTAAVRYAW